MPDPSTPRVGLYKSKSDGSELVSYPNDLGGNWDRVDAAVGYQAVTSTTRPSTPYPGKPITESDTSYRTYFSNGTAPASASWVEIPNSSGQFNSTLTMSTAGRLVLLNTNDVSLTSTNHALQIGATSGANLRMDNNEISAASNGAISALHIQPDGGDLTLFNNRASGSTTDTAIVKGNVSVGGDLKLVGGATTFRNQPTAAGVTVANSVTETVVGTFTLPAGDAVVGATYRARMIANVSFLASAQLTWRGRLGGLAGTLLVAAGPTTLSATAQTNKESILEVDLVCVSTGASGTWFAMLKEVRNTLAAGSVGDVQLSSTDGTVVQNTTIANDFVITAQWAAASTSNTLTARTIFERIA